MRFVRKAGLVVLPAVVAISIVAGAAPAFAASVNVVDLTAPSGVSLGADTEIAVFGVNLTGGGTLVRVRATFNDVGADGAFDMSDLQASPDGVAFYRDSSTGPGNDDTLDAGDTRISTGFTPTGLSIQMDMSSGIPASAEGAYTYLFAIRTSSTISDGDDFTVTLPSLFSAFQTQPIPTSFGGITSQTIKGDASVPSATLLQVPSGVSGTVKWQISEAVSGVNSGNAVIRLHNTTTDISALVVYNTIAHTITIDPLSPLALNVKYDTVVAPAGSDPIKDGAGNSVPTTLGQFTIFPPVITPGVVRGNVWYLSNTFDGVVSSSFGFGKVTDTPIVGDWNGDGITTPGIVRGNAWYLSNDLSGTVDTIFSFGKATDRPIVGDWDGDGTSDPGLVRGNEWFLNQGFDGGAEISFFFGKATDRPVAGDWNHDGTSDPGVVRGNNWFLSNNFDGITETNFVFGKSTDRPIVGDWNGDGTSDPGLIRGNSWYLNSGFDGAAEMNFAFGKATDIQVTGDWDGNAL